jgi:hypothetical protein
VESRKVENENLADTDIISPLPVELQDLVKITDGQFENYLAVNIPNKLKKEPTKLPELMPAVMMDLVLGTSASICISSGPVSTPQAVDPTTTQNVPCLLLTAEDTLHTGKQSDFAQPCAFCNSDSYSTTSKNLSQSSLAVDDACEQEWKMFQESRQKKVIQLADSTARELNRNRCEDSTEDSPDHSDCDLDGWSRTIKSNKPVLQQVEFLDDQRWNHADHLVETETCEEGQRSSFAQTLAVMGPKSEGSGSTRAKLFHEHEFKKESTNLEIGVLLGRPCDQNCFTNPGRVRAVATCSGSTRSSTEAVIHDPEALNAVAHSSCSGRTHSSMEAAGKIHIKGLSLADPQPVCGGIPASSDASGKDEILTLTTKGCCPFLPECRKENQLAIEALAVADELLSQFAPPPRVGQVAICPASAYIPNLSTLFITCNSPKCFGCADFSQER